MKRHFYKLFLLIIVISLVFTTCDLNLKLPSAILIWNIVTPFDPYEIKDTRYFWAQDLTNYGLYYQLEAILLAQNNFCNVWVEMDAEYYKDENEAETKAKAIADEYIIMYNKMLDPQTGFDAVFSEGYNTLQAADFMGDQDGKLCILLLDIKDGLEGTKTYVAGYYSWVNHFKDPYMTVNRSNESDMIYVSKRYELTENTYRVVAHELQHLMNFVTSVRNRNFSLMDLWIDEGLAGAAEWVYSGTHSLSRVEWYNDDESGLIKQGNNFFVWNNSRYSYSVKSVLDDYATAYLFFQWLRLQKGNGVYKDIINSPYSDYQAITTLFPGKTMGDLLEEWYIANYNNSYIGVGGIHEFNLKRHYILNPEGMPAYLYNGEGVFSFSKEPLEDIPENSGNIRYTNLTNALLALNGNTSRTVSAEIGEVTGDNPLAGSMGMRSASVSSEINSGPRAISAGELTQGLIR